MTTKEKFIMTMQIVGFNNKCIQGVLQSVRTDTDIDDIMSLISSTPNITKRALMYYVSVITNQN